MVLRAGCEEIGFPRRFQPTDHFCRRNIPVLDQIIPEGGRHTTMCRLAIREGSDRVRPGAAANRDFPYHRARDPAPVPPTSR